MAFAPPQTEKLHELATRQFFSIWVDIESESYIRPEL